MALKLLNGKFYDNGNIVPLEFGNWEQIRLIQAEVRRLEELEAAEEEGIPVEPYCNNIRTIYEIDVDHRCICKNVIWFSQETEDADDEDDAVEQYIKHTESKTKKCKCGIEWELKNVNNKLFIFKK
jgi:hypothetical protein